METNTTYRSCWLWLPKSKVNAAAVRTACTAISEGHRGEQQWVLFSSEWASHMVVPREFLPRSELPEPMVDLTTPGEDAEFHSRICLRDSQVTAWDAFDTTENGILNLACGRGKTVLALQKIAARGKAAIVIMDQGGLITQWIEEAQSLLGLRPGEIGLVQQEKAQWDKPLVIASIQTLANRAGAGKIPWSVRKRFGTIIYDESHHLSSPHFMKTAFLFLGQRYGLSATPKRTDGLEVIYQAHLGPIFFSDMTTDLDPTIFFVRTSSEIGMADRRILDRSREFNTSLLRGVLAADQQRNYQILAHIGRAFQQDRRVLALTHVKKHAEMLHTVVLGSGLITGDIPASDRRRILKTNRIIFATVGVAKEGLDAPMLDTVFFLTPFKNWNSFQQGAGRSLRLNDDKQRPVVVFFWDHKNAAANAMTRVVMRGVIQHGWRYRVLEQ